MTPDAIIEAVRELLLLEVHIKSVKDIMQDQVTQLSNQLQTGASWSPGPVLASA